MAIITGILNGTNLNRDFHFQSLTSQLTTAGVAEGFDNGLEVTTGSVATGLCFVEVTRTSVTPNETFLVPVRVTTPTTVDTTGDGYIIVSVDSAKVNDGSGNASDGSGIATIEKVAALPSNNYLTLATLASGVITDARTYSKVDASELSLSASGGIESVGGELQVKLNSGGHLVSGADGLSVTPGTLGIAIQESLSREIVSANFHNLWNKYYAHKSIQAYTSGVTLRLYDATVPSWEERNLTLDWADATTIAGVAIYSDFTYVFLTSATEKRIYRFTTGDLTSTGTLMTGLGASPGTNVQNSFGANLFISETAGYSSISFSVAGQETVPYGLALSSDGTKMFVVGGTGAVYQYTLSTAWNVGTASYDSVSFSVTGQETVPSALAFSSDGTKMFVVGDANDTVYQYSLSTAWNVGTASYDSISFSVAGQEDSPTGLAFSSDGTKMFVLGSVADTVYQYTLSTAWNVGTASYDSISFSVAGQDTSPGGLAFSSDGTKMFIRGLSNDTVYQYSLSTAWNVGTASYDSLSFSVAGQETAPRALAFSSDGTKMFVVGTDNDTVYQYSVPGGFSFEGYGVNEYSISGNTLTQVDTHTLNAEPIAVDSAGLYYQDTVIKKKLFVDDSIVSGLLNVDAINIGGQVYFEDSNNLYPSSL